MTLPDRQEHLQAIQAQLYEAALMLLDEGYDAKQWELAQRVVAASGDFIHLYDLGDRAIKASNVERDQVGSGAVGASLFPGLQP